jgi:hypothetical protein
VLKNGCRAFFMSPERGRVSIRKGDGKRLTLTAVLERLGELFAVKEVLQLTGHEDGVTTGRILLLVLGLHHSSLGLLPVFK